MVHIPLEVQKQFLDTKVQLQRDLDGIYLVVLQRLIQAADEFGDIEFVGYLGASYDKFYGEISGVTADDDIDWGAKAGVKFTF